MNNKKKWGIFLLVMVLLCTAIAGGIVANANTSVDYLADGEYTVSVKKGINYYVYYPKEIAEIEGELPLITWGNGTAMKPYAYNDLLSHFATHGFIVVASTSTMVGNGTKMLEAVDYMAEQNDDSRSIFYQKVDLDNIGAAGHSQGGEGAQNCGLDARVKCIAPIQSTKCDDVASIQCPMFLITGSLDYVVLKDIYVLPAYKESQVPTVYGVVKNASHTMPLFYEEKIEGYLTAWFYTYLKDDSNAMKYFCGDEFYLQSDKEWQDVKNKNY